MITRSTAQRFRRDNDLQSASLDAINRLNDWPPFPDANAMAPDGAGDLWSGLVSHSGSIASIAASCAPSQSAANQSAYRGLPVAPTAPVDDAWAAFADPPRRSAAADGRADWRHDRAAVDHTGLCNDGPPRHELQTREPPLARANANNTAHNHAHNQPHFFGNAGQANYELTINSLLLDYLQLQTTNVEKFCGEPADFPRFKAKVNEYVLSKNLPDSVKMSRLLQFLSGKALHAVKDLEGIPGALKVAINRLQRRFGENYMIVDACIRSITSGDNIADHDKDKYQSYADRLISVLCTLTSIGSVGQITTDHLRRVVWRLPVRDQARWRDRVSARRPREPPFESLVEFICERAQAVNDPVFTIRERATNKSTEAKPKLKGQAFAASVVPASSTEQTGCSSGTADRNTSQKRSQNPSSNLGSTTCVSAVDNTVASSYKNAGVTGSGQACPICVGSHRADRCGTFQLMDVDRRRTMARDKRLCFNCLQPGHGVASCRSVFRCRVAECGRAHHTLLHTERQVAPTGGGAEKNSATAHAVHSGKTSSITQILPVRVTSDSGGEATVYGLLDTGSTTTFIDGDLATELGLDGIPTDVSLVTLHGTRAVCGPRVSFNVGPPRDGVPTYRVQDAVALSDLSLGQAGIMSADSLKQWPYLQHLDLEQLSDRRVRLIIGTDVPHAFIPHNAVYGEPHEPVAVQTSLGWAIMGPVNCLSVTRCERNHTSSAMEVGDQDLHNTVGQMFDFEKFCLSGDKETFSVEDKVALETLNTEARLVEGHYQIPMLWAKGCPNLPNNRASAVLRLRHLRARFVRDADYCAQYSKVIEGYVASGYAHQMNPQDALSVTKSTWYLPHHGVTNPNKPGKLRVVFDAAAVYRGTCLNKQLVQGPNQTSTLIGVLLRFRQYNVALKADIEAMFHQVRVSDSDAEALRFLWWPGSVDEMPTTYQMTRHIFGAKSSPCCTTYALRRVARDNEESFPKEVVDAVHKNFYVDDFLVSVTDERKAETMLRDTRELLALGGFNLTKWSSNSGKVRDTIPAGHAATEAQAPLTVERALGVLWDTDNDTLVFRAQLKRHAPTKRGILSAIGSLFDPLGLIAPITLFPKIILQKLWKTGLSWDDPIPSELGDQWEKWLAEFERIEEISVPRCYCRGSYNKVQLHVFADASEAGYGSVLYLRFDDGNSARVSFLFGKSRVAPVKAVSIPRLELQAALVSVRLANALQKELQLEITNVVFWTDSTTVLGYLRNTSKRFHTFVANRVAEIHEKSSVSQWKHCPGSLNPADEASRGVRASQMHSNSRWYQGAAFLHLSESEWPEEESPTETVDDADPEVRSHQCLATGLRETDTHFIDAISSRHSSLRYLTRIIAWLIRFISFVRSKDQCEQGPLTTHDLSRAKERLVIAVQRVCFPKEYKALSEGRSVHPSSSIAALCPFISAETLRVGGRLQHAHLEYDVAHSLLLPYKHHLSLLVARECHERNMHAPTEYTIALVRQTYWILQCRRLVKTVIRNCLTCRRQNAQPMTQIMAPLPEERVAAYNPPFTRTGVDYFGPFIVTQGRRSVKRYGCIFTCLSTRACHIEISASLESDEFLNVLRRFIARRGQPKEIWSDNGTNFVGAFRDMRSAILESAKKARIRLDEWGIRWRFQPPKASHMSGVWERLIRTTRKALMSVAGLRALDDTKLQTLVAEAESMLNNRPLTANSDDPLDYEALTPAHFLLLRTATINDPINVIQGSVSSRRKWLQVQHLAHCFWKRWVKEYLCLLQSRQRWLRPQRDVKVGDLVLLCDNSVSRNSWPLARVQEVSLGRDGHVRAATVKTASSSFVRPIVKLCLLEEALDDCG